MNQQPYDLMLTAALFLCGMFGMIYCVENSGTLSLAISSAVVLIGSMTYMFSMPQYLSMTDRNENKNVVRFLCEVSQKTAMFAVVAQCFIILASATG